MRGLSGAGWGRSAGVRFRPGAAPAVLGLPASELVRPIELVRAPESMAYLAANP
jgi:hypothetical protein